MKFMITWRQWGVLLSIATIVGWLMGSSTFIVWNGGLRLSLGELALMMALVSGWGLVIAFAFAVVASPIGAALILLMRHWSAADVRVWMAAGVILGGLVGALHPFVLLSAVTEFFAEDPNMPRSLLIAALTALCGGVAGGLSGWWYRAIVIARDGLISAEGARAV